MLRCTDDPLRDFALWSDDQEEKLNKRPCCILCNNHIQDEYGYEIDGEWYCEDCIRDSKKYFEGD